MGKGTSDPSQFLLVFFHTHDLHIYIVHAYKKNNLDQIHSAVFMLNISGKRFPYRQLNLMTSIY